HTLVNIDDTIAAHYPLIISLRFSESLHPCSFSYFLSPYDHPRSLHSFPTRRSSDLLLPVLPPWETGATRMFFRIMGYPLCLLDRDRKSTRLNSSHQIISYAVFCLKKKKDGHAQGEAQKVACRGAITRRDRLH